MGRPNSMKIAAPANHKQISCGNDRKKSNDKGNAAGIFKAVIDAALRHPENMKMVSGDLRG
jgi:hypothetical protein